MILVATFSFLLLNMALSTAQVPGRRPSLQNLQDFHPEDNLFEIFMNPTSVVSNVDHTVFGAILDLDFKADDVTYELYTKNNREQAVILRTGDMAQLRDSSFDPTWPIKIIIHGWIENGDTFWYHDIRRNYLTIGDYNIICVNWFSGSNKEYLTSVRLTRQVGEYVAAFLEFLESEAHVAIEDIHVLGHSLGSHVAGYVGSSLSKKLGRITGLDPARPAYETPYLKDTEDRLDSTDANFVDVIHTCAGGAGFLRPIGHVDFFPNGGSFRQPGCPIFSAQTCSHGRSHQFFAESILHPDAFGAVQCPNWLDFQLGKCGNNITAVMGEFTSADTRGTFYLETNARSPFGRGDI